MPTTKPVEYIVEFYHTSFVNDPEYSVTSSTPIMGMSVGDYLYLGSWNVGTEKVYGKIRKLRHNIYDIDKDHVTHQIGVVFDYIETEEAHDSCACRK
jgi:hypothetical protein